METENQKVDRQKGRLNDQVAIVTGGGGGIGRATCVALAQDGARLVVVDIDQNHVQATLNEVQAQSGYTPTPDWIVGLVLDVRHEQDMEEMTRQTLSHFGRIDILVASAGILRPKGSGPRLVMEMSTAEWEEVLDINLKGVFLSNRAVLPTMISQRIGFIVNISSVSGRVGRAYDSAYCASKFGVIGLSEALAEEVRQYNIRVQVLLPDAVDTPLLAQSGPIPPPANVLSATRVADFIVYLLTLPEDTMLINPIIAPFQPRRRKPAPGAGGNRVE
jgi:NAD(P)-dependent dehydrogenase (short-subunit alcohol dehydrogenase family)